MFGNLNTFSHENKAICTFWQGAQVAVYKGLANS
jgi:hypothetical protein